MLGSLLVFDIWSAVGTASTKLSSRMRPKLCPQHIFFLLLTLALTAHPSFADHDYYHGKYRDRATLIEESEIAASVISLLESRYPTADVAVLGGDFIPVGVPVSFLRIQSLVSTEPLLCETLRSNQVYFKDYSSSARNLVRLETRSTGGICPEESVVLGVQATTDLKSKLVTKRSREADRWVLGQLSEKQIKTTNRVRVVFNEDNELVEVHIYELVSGIHGLFLRAFPDFQHPAPNGNHDRKTIVYNFALNLGVNNE